MDKERFELGLKQRKSTLGAEYVERNLAAADDFTKPFQEMMTEWCWGFGWGDDTIDAKNPLHDESDNDWRTGQNARMGITLSRGNQ